MNVSDAIQKYGLNIYAEGRLPEAEITGAYVSDLLSDVIGSAQQGQVWVTIHVHVNIVAVAVLKDLPAIIIAKGKIPDADTVQKAREEGVYLLGTGSTTFDFAGTIFNDLKKGN